MYFRAMTPDIDGLPLVGRSARRLSVRVPQDVTPNAAGDVLPGTGGMSVAPDSVWNLPHHRRPRGLERGSTGPSQDYVFSIAPRSLEGHGLVARPDPAAHMVHAFVEPTRPVPLDAFERALTATRSNWGVEWS